MPRKKHTKADYWLVIQKADRKALATALERHGSVTSAAQALGINRVTFYKRAARVGLEIRGRRPKSGLKPLKVSSLSSWAAPPAGAPSAPSGTASPYPVGGLPSWLIDAVKSK